MLENSPTSNEFLRSSQKFCPSFHYEGKRKFYWVYDRAVVAPMYPIGAGIRSNVVPLLWMTSAAKNLKDYQQKMHNMNMMEYANGIPCYIQSLKQDISHFGYGQPNEVKQASHTYKINLITPFIMNNSKDNFFFKNKKKM